MTDTDKKYITSIFMAVMIIGQGAAYATERSIEGSGFSSDQSSYIILAGSTSYANADLVGKNFSNQNLAGMDFSNADLAGVSFNGANLTGANFSNATFVKSDFRGANVTGADFSNADFVGCLLQGVDFSHSDMTNADISN